MPRRRRRPSTGFVTVCLVYAALALFFAWGLTTPDLDRVWTLHHELKAGRIGAPSTRDRAVLRRSMERHPELADALLPNTGVSNAGVGLLSSNMEGWIAGSEATIVRTRKAHANALQLEVASPDALLPIQLVLDGQGWKEKHELSARGVHDFALPAMKGESEVIVLRLKGRAASADPSVLGVRVSFATNGAGS